MRGGGAMKKVRKWRIQRRLRLRKSNYRFPNFEFPTCTRPLNFSIFRTMMRNRERESGLMTRGIGERKTCAGRSRRIFYREIYQQVL